MTKHITAKAPTKIPAGQSLAISVACEAEPGIGAKVAAERLTGARVLLIIWPIMWALGWYVQGISLI